MNTPDAPQQPDEHARFAAHLEALQQAAEADEADAVSRVLADPDRTMAQSAVLRHLDRRAADLHLGPAYERWGESMAQLVADHPFLTQRLHEWTLLRALKLGLPWRPDALLASSNWLQLRAAADSNPEALTTLAEAGRTKRIRTTATAGLGQRRLGR